MMYDWGGGPGFGLGGWLLMLLWWGLIVAAAVMLVRYLTTNAQSTNGKDKPEETALDILRKRYARGEIDKKEFEEKRKDLEK